MPKKPKKQRKCKFIEDEADLSGSGHEDDDNDIDEDELERQRLFVDDGPVEKNSDQGSPVHESEEELEDDDLELIRENNGDSDVDAVLAPKRYKSKPTVQESTDDEYDSMDDFIVDDSPKKRKQPLVVSRPVIAPAPRWQAADGPVPPPRHISTGRRSVESMSSYKTFKPPSTPAKISMPIYTWEFMQRQKAIAKPKPMSTGYVRTSEGLKYRKHDGTLVAATGVDRI